MLPSAKVQINNNTIKLSICFPTASTTPPPPHLHSFACVSVFLFFFRLSDSECFSIFVAPTHLPVRLFSSFLFLFAIVSVSWIENLPFMEFLSSASSVIRYCLSWRFLFAHFHPFLWWSSVEDSQNGCTVVARIGIWMHNETTYTNAKWKKTRLLSHRQPNRIHK